MLQLALLTVVTATGVYELPEDQFRRVAAADVRALPRYSAGLARLSPELERLRALRARAKRAAFTPDEKDLLLTTWAAVYDYVLSAELIRQRYWDFVKVPRTDAVKHGWGFLLTHSALTLELSHGLAFVELAVGVKQLETLLDEPSPSLGLPRGAFSAFKDRVVRITATTQLLTGDSYAKQMNGVFTEAGLLDDADALALVRQMRRDGKLARARLKRRGVKIFTKATVDVLADGAARSLFPVQRGVARWLGDTRVHRIDQPLIAKEQALALARRMEPGDVLVARQNWYLSNIGLPGFWPHAELYLGRPEKLAAYFDQDPDVSAFVRAQPEGAQTFSELLARRYPAKWGAYQGKDAYGDPVLVLEAISEGVAFTGVGHAMTTDYLAAMRPLRPKLEKAKAILRAFHYQGRPYDFDFDFFSDASLVCTELVFKSYAPSADMIGLRLQLMKVAGRMTLPANELVRTFDREYATAAPQLGFVGFLDGSEDQKTAIERDADSFRATHARVKWDIAQE